MDDPKDPKDALGVTPDPSAGEKGTSEKEPEPFTKESQEKAVSDALSKAGRDAKTFTSLKENLEADRKRLTDDRIQWRKEKDEEKMESIRDDPDALKSFRAEQKRRDRESELDDREQELKTSEEKHAEALKAVVTYTKEHNAREIATRLNVDFEPLMKFCDSTEAMEELAQSLPKKGETQTLIVDSSKTIGGAKDLSGISPIRLGQMGYSENK